MPDLKLLLFQSTGLLRSQNSGFEKKIYAKTCFDLGIPEVDTSLSSKRIIRSLEKIIALRGATDSTRSDHSPEFTGGRPSGKPTHKVYIVRFNRLYQEAVLDGDLFSDVEQAAADLVR